jgi:2TM domain
VIKLQLVAALPGLIPKINISIWSEPIKKVFHALQRVTIVQVLSIVNVSADIQRSRLRCLIYHDTVCGHMKNKYSTDGDAVRSPKIKSANGQELTSTRISPSNVTLERYKEVYRDMIIRREKKAFTKHSIAYAIGNTLLIAINLLFVPQFLWFVFPLVGWGSGLAIHYYLGVRTAPRRIEKDEMMAENLARGGLDASLA